LRRESVSAVFSPRICNSFLFVVYPKRAFATLI
jgi:hypothetical protein